MLFCILALKTNDWFGRKLVKEILLELGIVELSNSKLAIRVKNRVKDRVKKRVRTE